MAGDTREIIYNPADVAKQLNIKESTLRKYSLLLEKYGYEFHKNERGQRGYYDSDIIVLRRMMEFKNGGMTLEKASLSVATWAKRGNVTHGDTALQRYDKRYMGDIDELKKLIHKQGEMIEKQNELIKQLAERLDRQQEYIERRMNERDRLLLQTLRETQETQKQLAAASKTPFWKRLFRK